LNDRKRRAVIAMLTLLVLISAVGALVTSKWPVVAQGPELPLGPASSGEEFEPGRILVKFSQGVTVAGAEGTLQQHGATYVRTLYDSSVQLWAVPEGSELSTASLLSADPTVEYAEPNYRFYAFDKVPNDPSFNVQWAHALIHSQGAWDNTTGSVTEIIAIIDTGIDEAHPDLAGKIVAGWDYVDNDSDPHDLNGHGTHVAGIAAAMTNNGEGVAGMDWSARIMPIRVLDDVGSGYSADVAEGIRWACNHGARVLNLSLGGPADETLLGAVDDAYAAGCLVVAAMGNEGSATPKYPAAYDHVLAVAATGPSDTRALYSNYGAHCDVAAPGGTANHDPNGIYSTMPTGDAYMITEFGFSPNYDYVSGTSQATPYVSGLAALLWTLQPSLTPDQVQSTIQSTAMDLGAAGWDAYYGYGRIDALAAVCTFVPPAVPVLSAISNTDGDGAYLVDWNDVPHATGYTLEEDDSASFSSPATRYTDSNSQYQVTGRPVGIWYYRVRANNPCWGSVWSNVQAVGVWPGPPSLNLTPVGDDAYRLAWSAATVATGYTLEEDDNPSFSSPGVRYQGSALQYNVTGQPGGTWYYRVRGYNSAGGGPWSLSISKAVPQATLAAPSLRIDNADGYGQFEVAWTDVPLATSYVLEQSRDAYFSSPTVLDPDAVSPFQVSGQPRGRWHYRVRAFGWGGRKGPWSNSEFVVVPFRIYLPFVAKNYAGPGW